MRLLLVTKSFPVLIDINRHVTKAYNFTIYNNYDQPVGNYVYDIMLSKICTSSTFRGFSNLELGLIMNRTCFLKEAVFYSQ